MKKLNTKKMSRYSGLILVLVAVGGGSGYFGYQAGKNKTPDTIVVSEESSDKLRGYIEIVEDNDGNIRIKEQELDAAVGMGNPRPFTEIIPTTCEAAIKRIKDLMRGKNSIQDLGPKVRGDFTFTTMVAKDLCTYEDYRYLLVGDLGKFIFSDIQTGTTEATAPVSEGGASTETTTSSVPGEK
jgi:hypothetical protein